MTQLLQVLLPGAQHLQNLHPLIVHFPIVFLISAALLYALVYGFMGQSGFLAFVSGRSDRGRGGRDWALRHRGGHGGPLCSGAFA